MIRRAACTISIKPTVRRREHLAPVLKKEFKMGLKEVSDYENLHKAGIQCCKAGRWKASIQNFEMCLPRATSRARQKLLSHKFNPTRTNDFWITERGKDRLIRAHTVYDRQIYKSYCDHDLKPSFSNYILDHNNASQIDKGTDRSIKQFRQGLAKAYKKYGKYDKALKIRRLVSEQVKTLFKDYDALLCPACSKTAYRPYDIKDAFDAVFAESLFTAIPNLTGVPSMVCGGVQFISDALQDGRLLNLAEALEGGAAQ